MIRKIMMAFLFITLVALIHKPITMSMMGLLTEYLAAIEPIIISVFGESGYKYVLAMFSVICFSFYLKPFSFSGILAIISTVLVSLLICTRIYINIVLEFGDEFKYEAMIEAGKLGELGGEVLPYFFQMFTNLPPSIVLNILLLIVVCALVIMLIMQIFRSK